MKYIIGLILAVSALISGAYADLTPGIKFGLSNLAVDEFTKNTIKYLAKHYPDPVYIGWEQVKTNTRIVG